MRKLLPLFLLLTAEVIAAQTPLAVPIRPDQTGTGGSPQDVTAITDDTYTPIQLPGTTNPQSTSYLAIKNYVLAGSLVADYVTATPTGVCIDNRLAIDTTSDQIVAYCKAGTWQALPPAVATPELVSGATASLPATCTAPSLFHDTDLNQVTHACEGGAWVQLVTLAPTFIGADGTNDAVSGLVPAADASADKFVFFGDGQFRSVATVTNVAPVNGLSVCATLGQVWIDTSVPIAYYCSSTTTNTWSPFPGAATISADVGNTVVSSPGDGGIYGRPISEATACYEEPSAGFSLDFIGQGASTPYTSQLGGFTFTPAATVTLDQLDAVMQGPGFTSIAVTMEIRQGAALGSPVIATSLNSPSINPKGTYSFNFAPIVLNAGQPYTFTGPSTSTLSWFTSAVDDSTEVEAIIVGTPVGDEPEVVLSGGSPAVQWVVTGRTDGDAKSYEAVRSDDHTVIQDLATIPGTWTECPTTEVTDNLYTADGTLADDRTVSGGGNATTTGFGLSFRDIGFLESIVTVSATETGALFVDHKTINIESNNNGYINRFYGDGSEIGMSVDTGVPASNSSFVLGFGGPAFTFGSATDLELDGDPGTAGQQITSQGPGFPPVWADPPAAAGNCRYDQAFDAAGDWGTAAGGFYTITIADAAHTLDQPFLIDVYDTSSGSSQQVTPAATFVDANDDVRILVSETPDTRFPGRIVISTALCGTGATGGAAGPIGDLTDVDTTTTPPATGDLFTFNGGAWVPVTINPVVSGSQPACNAAIDGHQARYRDGDNGNTQCHCAADGAGGFSWFVIGAGTCD